MCCKGFLDHLHFLLSLKDKPNVIISDMPYTLPGHMQKSKMSFFQNNKGMLFLPVEANIDDFTTCQSSYFNKTCLEIVIEINYGKKWNKTEKNTQYQNPEIVMLLKTYGI